MNDVARLARVGTMTVSRVLSGSVPVSAETAQRVLIAVEQLKYRPNELARAFRGQRSHTIGLIIPYLYDPFFANCAHAVTAVAKEHGYSVIIATSNEDSNTEFEEVENMLRRHVDGLVAIPARCHESRLTRALFSKTPVVIFDRPVPGLSLDVVTVQNTAGARRSCGCKNRTSVVIHSMIAEPASEAWKQRTLERKVTGRGCVGFAYCKFDEGGVFVRELFEFSAAPRAWVHSAPRKADLALDRDLACSRSTPLMGRRKPSPSRWTRARATSV